MDSRGWERHQTRSSVTLDESYRERLQRSIQHLRHTSHVGDTPHLQQPSHSLLVPRHDSSMQAQATPIETMECRGQFGWKHRKRNECLDGRLDGQGEQLPRSKGRNNSNKRGRLLLIIDVRSRQGAVEEIYVRDGDSVYALAEGFIARHGLGAQHVRTAGIHIQAKILEIGCTVDTEGRCWGSATSSAGRAIEADGLKWAACGDPTRPTGHKYTVDPSSDNERYSRRAGYPDQRQPRRRERANYGALPHAGNSEQGLLLAARYSEEEEDGEETRETEYDLASEVDGADDSQCDPGKAPYRRRREAWERGGGVDEPWPSTTTLDRKEILSSPRMRFEDERELGLHPPAGTEGYTGFTDGETESTSPADGWWVGKVDFDRELVCSNDGAGGTRVRGRYSGSGTGRTTKEYAAVFPDIPRTGAINDEEKAFRRAWASWGEPLRSRDCGQQTRSHDTQGARHNGDLLEQRNASKPSQKGIKTGANRVEFGYRRDSPAAGSDCRSRNTGRHRQNITNTPWKQYHSYNEREIEAEVGGWESAPECRRGANAGRDGRDLRWRSRGAAGRRPVSRDAVRQLHVSERLYQMAGVFARKRERARRRRDDLQKAREAQVTSGRLSLCSKTRELTDNLPRYTYGRRNDKVKANTEGDRWKGGGGGYQDAGDRLYSEWQAERKRKVRRRDFEAAREAALPGAWSCPKCGSDNRAQDDTCQTVTGIAVPAQDTRPDTWHHESSEQLGRAAAAAKAAGAVDDRSNRRNIRGRIGDDGLRRCARPRPPMFQPTPLARPGQDTFRLRPKGELLFDDLYRNPPTPSRRRTKRILDAETKASCTFTPAINERSVRLAEAHESRRTLTEAALRWGSEEDGESRLSDDNPIEGDGSGSRAESNGESRGGGGARTGAQATPSKVMTKALQLYGEHAKIEQRKEEQQREFFSRTCPFTPDIGMSAAWPAQDISTEEFVSRLHSEHWARERRVQEKRYMQYQDSHSAVDPDTGQPLFSPTINKRRQNRPRTDGVGQRKTEKNREWWSLGSGGREGTGEVTAGEEGDPEEQKGVHARLWDRGLALTRRREAGARVREDARKARASGGHVNGRSAEIVRAMRVRSLMQTYRTLLASVEYARLPEGLDYDEAMASITTKINAIFDNDDDAWQEMTLEVAKADPTVLEPELVDIVTTALAGHGEEIISLPAFCELLDASVKTLATAGGPTAHLFASGAGKSASGAELAAAAAAARAKREADAELKEMTFRPKIDKKSVAMARALGRDGRKSIEEVFQREASKQERRRRDRCRQQEAAFKKECPFTPTRFSSSAPIASTVRSRCPNDTAAEDQDAPAASGAEENIQIGGEGEGNVVVGWGAPAARSRSPI